MKAKEGNVLRVRKQTAIARPVARTEGLVTETVGDETVVFDVDSKEAHCLKSLAAAVFMYADGSRTASDIAELAAYRMGTPVTVAEVNDAFAQLDSRSLLDQGPVVVRNGISRRDALKRFGAVAGVAAATPLIATVSASAAPGDSKIPTGGCCGNTKNQDTCTGGNPLCQSGHCCQNLDATAKACNPCKCVGDKNDCSIDQCNTATSTTDCTALTGHTLCGKTSGGRCCYRANSDPTQSCCTVFLSAADGIDVQC
jgi:hypothetical protein